MKCRGVIGTKILRYVAFALINIYVAGSVSYTFYISGVNVSVSESVLRRRLYSDFFSSFFWFELHFSLCALFTVLFISLYFFFPFN